MFCSGSIVLRFSEKENANWESHNEITIIREQFFLDEILFSPVHSFENYLFLMRHKHLNMSFFAFELKH